MTDAWHDGADRAPRQGDRLVLRPLGETQMRKIILAAGIALMLAGVGVWATLTVMAVRIQHDLWATFGHSSAPLPHQRN